jgi:hypothetical protein
LYGGQQSGQLEKLAIYGSVMRVLTGDLKLFRVWQTTISIGIDYAWMAIPYLTKKQKYKARGMKGKLQSITIQMKIEATKMILV